VEELRRSELCKRIFSAAAAASSSCFFFLNRVSAIGRKKVQSNPYCLQCWHKGGSESGKTSHLFDGGWVSKHKIRRRQRQKAMGTRVGVGRLLIAVKQKGRTEFCDCGNYRTPFAS
jgi:hypothetical protein